ncbi:alpha/beta fold hydrolase [Streptomyces sp. NPDC093224]|uniref:alpha/beta fold hydrolase n=1 Tax=Streptomyces sp. NPDC093224 TaxID=3155198 RepID=UPI003433A19B
MARTNGQTGLVLVHGLLSSPDAWTPFQKLIGEDRELAFVTPLPFGYATPFVRVGLRRRIPSFDDIADSLKGFLEVEAQEYDDLVLVSHSQGGLVVQRYLHRMLNAGRGTELARIKLVCLFACPNSGSEILLSLRRLLPKHPQERQLRPLNAMVAESHSSTINRVVHAGQITASSCPIPFRVYVGDSDNIVPAESARGVFPQSDISTLPGDHSSLIRPDTAAHRSFTTLRRDLLAMRDGLGTPLETGSGPAPDPRPEAAATPVTAPERPHAPSGNVQYNNASGSSRLYAVQNGTMGISQAETQAQPQTQAPPSPDADPKPAEPA